MKLSMLLSTLTNQILSLLCYEKFLKLESILQLQPHITVFYRSKSYLPIGPQDQSLLKNVRYLIYQNRLLFTSIQTFISKPSFVDILQLLERNPDPWL